MPNKKYPTTGQQTVTGTKSGLNLIVSYIGSVFDTVFNDTANPNTSQTPSETLLHVFGLADKMEAGEGVIMPIAYTTGALIDPIELLPTDRWPGFMFFNTSDPVTYEIPKKSPSSYHVFETVQLNVIMFFNMKSQGYYTKWGYDPIIQKEALRERVLKVLTVDTPKKGCQFNVLKSYDKNIEDVFNGYSVGDMSSLQPYYAIRLECEVKFNQPC
jgi:hypothetical protein